MLWAGQGEGAEVDGASLDPEGTKEPQILFLLFFLLLFVRFTFQEEKK